LSDTARVESSDAIVDFRAALLTFLDEVRRAMESVHMKADRTLRWLDEDVPSYWHREEQRSYDAVNAARIALQICRTRTVAGRKSSCIEEKVEYRRSQERLEFCRAQKGRVRSTSIDAHHAADDFRARMARFERFVESDLPKLQALLHRTSVALDAYTATRPPSVRPQPPSDAAGNDGGGSPPEGG
jgi:hypothetical protein